MLNNSIETKIKEEEDEEDYDNDSVISTVRYFGFRNFLSTFLTARTLVPLRRTSSRKHLQPKLLQDRPR